MKNPWIRRLLLKLTLFLLPLLLLLGVDLLVLPKEFFTFRAWEALRVQTFYPTLTGPFYPNQQLEIEEEGELTPHTDFAVKKKVTWYTDQYGYRNRPSDKKPEVVIIGDSYTTGVKLDQDEVISERLQGITGKHVYSLAPAPANYQHMDNYFALERFQKNPPKVVVLAKVEEALHLLQPVSAQEVGFLQKVYKRSKLLPKGEMMEKLATTYDRFQKKDWYHWINSRFERAFNPPKPIIYQGEAFRYGPLLEEDDSQSAINSLVSVIKGYQEKLAQQGVDFIFIPIPNKENIYYRLLPNQSRPTLIPKLLAQLQAEGIKAVDLQTPFDSAAAQGTKLYHVDDNHWNEIGVDITIKHLLPLIHTSRERPINNLPVYKMEGSLHQDSLTMVR